MSASFEDSTNITPIFFILSPGADVVADVDKLAKEKGFVLGDTYHQVSLGQGQDVVAMRYLDAGHRHVLICWFKSWAAYRASHCPCCLKFRRDVCVCSPSWN